MKTPEELKTYRKDPDVGPWCVSNGEMNNPYRMVEIKANAKEIRNCHINVGTGIEITIRECAELIVDTIGYKGNLCWNTDKPDGTPRKLTDVSKLHNLGWRHTVELPEGIKSLYQWYIEH